MAYPAGRPRKPPALRPVSEGEGTARSTETLFEIPEAPQAFAAEEREAWEDLRQAINPKAITTAGDMIAFKLVVQALATARRAYIQLATKGLIEAGDKMDRPSPAAAIMASQQKLVWHGLARFGLTPADRSRVKADGPARPENGSNPEDEFGVA